MSKRRSTFRAPQHLHLPSWLDRTPSADTDSPAPQPAAQEDDPIAQIAALMENDLPESPHASTGPHPGDEVAQATDTPYPSSPLFLHETPPPTPPTSARSPYFLDQLADIRHADAVSGRTWRSVQGMSTRQATAMGHIDRTQCALTAVASLLQASENCRRRRPEDFGIGDDHHEGLVLAVRELIHAQRTHINTLEKRAPTAHACWQPPTLVTTAQR